MVGTDIVTVNTTFKIQAGSLVELENWLYANLDVVGFRIVPNTEKLYEEDAMFKKLVKIERDARVAKEKYINNHL
jgi:hypothetical protein